MKHTIMSFVIQRFAVVFPAFLVVFTVRGFARAFVARRMGDDTAYHEGFLSLNPIVHVDVVMLSFLLFVSLLISGIFEGRVYSSLVYNILIFMGIRWSYRVPIETRNFKRFKLGTILTTIAGPLGCFSLVLVFLYIARYLPYHLMSDGVVISLVSICRETIRSGLWFGVFHLLPIPPLDGGRLLQFMLPPSKQAILSWLETYFIFILIGLLVLPGVSDVFGAAMWSVCHGVYGLLSKFVF
ncbi:site-2 protease family protein [Candidatus Dependentiae bacterium]|nr:site-2 protease family protein [Candidatus Dependentiae bacterium]